MWGEIGWELRRAKTTEHLRLALRPVAENYSNYIGAFVRERTSRATPQILRSTRKLLGDLATEIYECSGYQRQVLEKLDQAMRARETVRGTSQESVIELVYQKRQQAAASHAQRWETLQQRYRELLDRLNDQEAYVAQTELLLFIRSGRYSFTPLNLANAMAGLPFMSWRRSSKRCSAIHSRAPYGFPYQLFLIIQRANKRSSRKKLLAAIRESLLKTRKTDFVGVELRRKWYYVRSAVDEVLRQRHHPGAIPYRILSEYQRRVSSPSQLDLVLEEEEQL